MSSETLLKERSPLSFLHISNVHISYLWIFNTKGRQDFYCFLNRLLFLSVKQPEMMIPLVIKLATTLPYFADFTRYQEFMTLKASFINLAHKLYLPPYIASFISYAMLPPIKDYFSNIYYTRQRGVDAPYCAVNSLSTCLQRRRSKQASSGGDSMECDCKTPMSNRSREVEWQNKKVISCSQGDQDVLITQSVCKALSGVF